jgi:CubicO group peptidase (beta-lactamase class C family)
MKETFVNAVPRVSLLQIVSTTVAMLVFTSPAASQNRFPTKQWSTAQPGTVGLDASKIAALDADIAGGKYGLVDSMLVIRCGKLAYEDSYPHDYGKIYGERAKKQGPLNHDVNGPYNYFSSEFHPFYRRTDLHTMQSVSKTVTSVTIGIAMGRKDFVADLDAPILKYFDEHKLANLDDRKRRITLRNLLTMSAGLEWNEDVAYDDPKNSADVMEATHDWVQYVIDRPMESDPGTKFVYSSGITQLLSHIFNKVIGRNVDEYAAEYLFKPLGIHYHWKHSPTGLPDTEGGLYLSSRDFAKIGYLYLNGGRWDGKQLVPEDWVKASVKPYIETGQGGSKYGFQWWLEPYGQQRDQFAWAAEGFGGQELRVVPELGLIFVLTGWDILPSTPERPHDALDRIVAAVDTHSSCGTAAK